MPFVLDASIAAGWYVDEPRHPRTELALHRLSDDDAIAPPIWWFEVCHVMLVAERRKGVSAQYSARFLEQLKSLPITIVDLSRHDDALALGRRHRLTFHDAAYLELAVRERVALATLDDDLVRAARAEGVALIG